MIALPPSRGARRAILVLGLAMLAACSSNTPKNVEVTGPAPAPPPAAALPPSAGPAPRAGPMKAAEIMQTLSNKSFKYTRAGRSGTITFASDGTFTYQETGKGEGSGVWQASEGRLCEAFNPSSSLPKGTRSECFPFSWTGADYSAGDARYQPL